MIRECWIIFTDTRLEVREIPFWASKLHNYLEACGSRRFAISMYSNASFLNTGNGSRSNANPQYGQLYQQSGVQQGPGTLPQAGGIQGNPLQSQQTGMLNPNQLSTFSGAHQQPQPFIQPQLTDYPTHVPSTQQHLMPAATGQTSAQVAQSFQGADSSQEPSTRSVGNGVRIPKIRLSFLTAQDQARFEQLFKSAVGDGQALGGMTPPVREE